MHMMYCRFKDKEKEKEFNDILLKATKILRKHSEDLTNEDTFDIIKSLMIIYTYNNASTKEDFLYKSLDVIQILEKIRHKLKIDYYE